jgi:hypothetical protein
MKVRHHERPGYVTFICVLILIGAVAFLGLYFLAAFAPKNQLQGLLYWWYYLGVSALSFVCGIFMLMGANWARLLFFTGYAGVCLWSYFYWAAQQPVTIPAIIFHGIILVVFCIALSAEGANRFFTRRDTFFKNKKVRGGFEPRSSSRGKFDY